MRPACVAGLIGLGDRKSVQPMAARDRAISYDQLHHFIADRVWDSAPLEAALLAGPDRLVGGEEAFPVIADTCLPKKGERSVGVGPQYASSLGKTADCQSLVSVTLASGEVPVTVGLRLFLPEVWTNDPGRMARARVPEDRQTALKRRSPTPSCNPAASKPRSGKERVPGPSPQPTMPAVGQAILDAFVRPPPMRHPHCERLIAERPKENPPKSYWGLLTSVASRKASHARTEFPEPRASTRPTSRASSGCPPDDAISASDKNLRRSPFPQDRGRGDNVGLDSLDRHK